MDKDKGGTTTIIQQPNRLREEGTVLRADLNTMVYCICGCCDVVVVIMSFVQVKSSFVIVGPLGCISVPIFGCRLVKV